MRDPGSFSASPRNLLSKARSAGAAPPVTAARLRWLDGNRILAFALVSEGAPQMELWTRDVSTGETHRLAEFNQQYQAELQGQPMIMRFQGRPGSELTYNPPRFDLSPDRTRLLWSNGEGRMIADLEGRELNRVPVDRSSSMALWLEDSRSWVSVHVRPSGQTYVVDGLKVHDGATVRQLAADFADGLWMSSMQDGSIVLRNPTRQQIVEQQASLTLVRLGEARAEAERLSVPLPMPACVSDAVLCPATGRIAWLLALSERPPRTYVLQVSDLRGQHFVELGRLEGSTTPAPERPLGVHYHWPQSLAWSPDGSALSFVYARELFVISASPV